MFFFFTSEINEKNTRRNNTVEGYTFSPKCVYIYIYTCTVYTVSVYITVSSPFLPVF